MRVKYIGDCDSIMLETYNFAVDMNLKRFELYNVDFGHDCEICDFDKVSYIVTNSFILLGDWLATDGNKCTTFFDLGGMSKIEFKSMMQSNLSLDLYYYDRSKYSSLDIMIADCLLRHKSGSLIIFNGGL